MQEPMPRNETRNLPVIAGFINPVLELLSKALLFSPKANP